MSIAHAKKRRCERDHQEILIGVTGHRTFAAGERSTAAVVAAELERIAVRHPDVEVTCITALAEGTDRLVARLARKILGARIHVSLPMPASAYEMDFATEASRRTFRKMLAAAERVIEAPILSRGRAWRRYTEERNHQYAWGGAYVARNADILLTIWDGTPARGTGGTAFVVDWFLEGRTPRRYAMSRWTMTRAPSPAPGLLIHVDAETLRVRRRRRHLANH
jgi:hypothetical protein